MASHVATIEARRVRPGQWIVVPVRGGAQAEAEVIGVDREYAQLNNGPYCTIKLQVRSRDGLVGTFRYLPKQHVACGPTEATRPPTYWVYLLLKRQGLATTVVAALSSPDKAMEERDRLDAESQSEPQPATFELHRVEVR